MRIKAAITPASGKPFEVDELELDAPREDEILVRIVGAGLCHTDLSCRDQYYPVPLPAVLGHEGSGVVEAVGARVTSVVPGDHVVLSFHSCGKCRNCTAGSPGYCLELFNHNFSGARPNGDPCIHRGKAVVHGSFFGQSSFATHSLAYERNTVKVDKDLPLAMVGPLGCGLQTGAGAVINSLRPGAGSSIAVFGVGAVGMSAVMAARVVGCTKIIAVDTNQGRLDLARELGATHTVVASGEAVQQIQALTNGGVDFSIEATGVTAALRQAVDSLTLLGVCGVVGVTPLGTEVSLDVNGIIFGRTVRGIIEGDAIPQRFIPILIALHRQGRFPFEKLIKYYALDEINQAVADSESGAVVKPILKM